MPPTDPPRDPRSEDQVDREAETPRTSNTYNIYAAAAHERADELDRFARMKRKQLVPEAYAAAERAEVLSAALRELGARFGAWPGMSPETVAFERYDLNLPGQLLELREQARVLMSSA